MLVSVCLSLLLKDPTTTHRHQPLSSLSPCLSNYSPQSAAIVLLGLYVPSLALRSLSLSLTPIIYRPQTLGGLSMPLQKFMKRWRATDSHILQAQIIGGDNQVCLVKLSALPGFMDFISRESRGWDGGASSLSRARNHPTLFK